MYYRCKEGIMTSSFTAESSLQHQSGSPPPTPPRCHRLNTLVDRSRSQVLANLCSPHPQVPDPGLPLAAKAVNAVALRVPSAAPGRRAQSAQARSDVAWAWLGPEGVTGLHPRALRGLSGSERTASLPRAFGRSEWAEARLGAGVVTRGRGRTPRASRGAL